MHHTGCCRVTLSHMCACACCVKLLAEVCHDVHVQVAAIEGEILLVSQFTLYGRLKKPKPDYSKAMGPDQV
jgi:D-Tyr-tRNAtyr deacylase